MLYKKVGPMLVRYARDRRRHNPPDADELAANVPVGDLGDEAVEEDEDEYEDEDEDDCVSEDAASTDDADD
jgi:hypothetical protein